MTCTTRIRDVFQGTRVEKHEICGIEPDQVPQCQCIGRSTIGWHSPASLTLRLLRTIELASFSLVIDVLSADRVLWQLICL
jgi:hypothetical protein